VTLGLNHSAGGNWAEKVLWLLSPESLPSALLKRLLLPLSLPLLNSRDKNDRLFSAEIFNFHLYMCHEEVFVLK
jgi:hypothetical protein